MMTHVRVAACLMAALLLGAASAWAAQRGGNLLKDPGFESDAPGWDTLSDRAFDARVRHSGKRSLRCAATDAEGAYGVTQVVALDPPVQHPLLLSGWSKAEGVSGQDYSLYLDIHYADGTPLWGQQANFSHGTHDWEYRESIIEIGKPIAKIEVFVFLRKAKGTAWFDDLRLMMAPFQFEGLRLLPGLYGGLGVDVAGGLSLPGKWQVALTRGGREVARQEGAGRRLRAAFAGKTVPPGDYAVRLSATDDVLKETIRRTDRVRLKPSGGGDQGETGDGRRETVRGSAASPSSRAVSPAASASYGVWTESGMVRVMPRALPEAAPPRRPRAQIRLAKGEAESFQVVLLPAPGRPLRNVRVRLGDLVGHAGKRIASRHLEWQQVGYVRVEKTWRFRHPFVRDLDPGWWPDPLLPVERFDVQPGFAQPVWVTLTAPGDAAAGDYAGRLQILADGEPATAVDVNAHVYDFALPVAGRLKNAFALMDGFLEQIYGPLTPALRRRYGDFLLRHRMNPDDISRTAAPDPDDIAYYRDRLNAYNVLNMVEERGKATWVCFSETSTYTPAFKARLIERLDPAVGELRRRGLLNKAYIYTFDERGEEYNDIITDYFGLVKQRYPGIYTLTTAYVDIDPSKMKALNIDALCPVTARYDFAKAEAARRQGLQVWSYICLGPRYPYANWLVEEPLIEARVIGWQAYREKMDGFLYWGLNIWGRKNNDRAVDPKRGPFLDFSITTGGDYDDLNGDGVLLYPGSDGPIGSIRLAGIRDGSEDYDYLSLLADRHNGDWEPSRAACIPVALSLTEFTRDPKTLLHARDAVARELER